MKIPAKAKAKLAQTPRKERFFAVFRLKQGGPLKSISFTEEDMSPLASAGFADLAPAERRKQLMKQARELIQLQRTITAKQIVDLSLESQGDYLRRAADVMGMTQPDFAQRINTPFRTYEKWLFPSSSPNAREMPPMAWTFIDEIVTKFASEQGDSHVT